MNAEQRKEVDDRFYKKFEIKDNTLKKLFKVLQDNPLLVTLILVFIHSEIERASERGIHKRLC